MGDEADYLECIAWGEEGHLTYGGEDLQDDLLELHRKCRRSWLDSNYVIACTGRKEQLFLQDLQFGSQFWTKFLTNARAFKSLTEAKALCSKFQYGSPRVLQVSKEGLRIIE